MNVIKTSKEDIGLDAKDCTPGQIYRHILSTKYYLCVSIGAHTHLIILSGPNNGITSLHSTGFVHVPDAVLNV